MRQLGACFYNLDVRNMMSEELSKAIRWSGYIVHSFSHLLSVAFVTDSDNLAFVLQCTRADIEEA